MGGHSPLNDSFNDDILCFTGPDTLPQLDGNASFLSDTSSPETLTIPVHVTPRSRVEPLERLPPTLKVIKKSVKVANAQCLPRISVYNARSLFPKIESLALDIHERQTDICFISEIWEQRQNKKHTWRITELLELKGIQYIST